MQFPNGPAIGGYAFPNKQRTSRIGKVLISAKHNIVLNVSLLSERMADDRLPKRAAEIREEGRMRRGTPRLIWEDCVKRDVKKTGEEEDWKKKTGDRG